ncbi:hypothetical protein [Mycolicibacterium hippocampi]|uniref:Uncharacterized protein n=1 Tax=Mycolicibacterium hippocampi TaxID=659824 RepID=A0A7I9ZL85_9MYCO|nr:hypothetical protein [Mycolicibacterium hippocampi]GFH01457.1 hypothetical protein MHIP_19400 [Mycolicibacterium hippocampi]
MARTEGRLRGGLARSRETLAALIASPQTPILQLVGGWRGVFDAVGPASAIVPVPEAVPAR